MPAEQHADAEQPTDRSDREYYSLALRIGCWGGLLVAAIGYAVLIPMKTAGELPPEMTWIRVIFGPALLVSLPVAPILITIRFPGRQEIALSILVLAYIVIGLGLVLLDSALSP